MMVTGSHGVRMQYDYTGDVAGLPGAVSATSPRWLRLTRSGDIITGYDSADGTHWTLVGTAQLAGLPATVQAGMFAATPPIQQDDHVLHRLKRRWADPALATAVVRRRQPAWQLARERVDQRQTSAPARSRRHRRRRLPRRRAAPTR